MTGVVGGADGELLGDVAGLVGGVLAGSGLMLRCGVANGTIVLGLSMGGRLVGVLDRRVGGRDGAIFFSPIVTCVTRGDALSVVGVVTGRPDVGPPKK